MRRDILKTGLALAVGSTLTGNSFAQGANVAIEGTNYRRVAQALPTEDPKKIELVEFFWYACPHCFALEGPLQDWAKQLPADVVFRKEHVAFPQSMKHQQLFYTLRSLGVDAQMTPKIFDSIHNERKPLLQTNDMADLVAKHGVDRQKFLDAYPSFTVITKAKRAASLSEGFAVDGVPAFGVNGRLFTSPEMCRPTGANVFKVLEQLIAQERKRIA